MKKNMNKLTGYARELRKKQTRQEQKLWSLLRNRRYKGLCFKRQYVIENYIVDFICREKKLIIELDGGQHNETKNIEYDTKRTEYLEEQGFMIMRFWNNEIDTNIDGVFSKIDECLKQSSHPNF